MLEDLPLVPDPDWSLYDEDDYIGKIDALDIHNDYTYKTNKVSQIIQGYQYTMKLQTLVPCV